MRSSLRLWPLLSVVLWVVLVVMLGCGAATPTAAVPKPEDPSPPPPKLTAHLLPLPGAGEGGVGMDYLAYDRAHEKVWVPAGNTGSVDVIDASATPQPIARIEGFATKEATRQGHTRVVGPSSATVGDGVVYVGNRADSSVCAIDAVSLAKLGCVTLASSPDGLAWVSATQEVWVTTPSDRSITILDAEQPAKLSVVAKVVTAGEPEGYAVDAAFGVFYTNLEDTDQTLQIDLKTRKVVATWPAGCGGDGPRGLAFEPQLHFLFLACTDRVKTLDPARDGKIVSELPTGAGVDNLDYVPTRRELYAAAGKAATLTVAHVGDTGNLTIAATAVTAAGARNAVATDEGAAYLIDSAAGSILMISR